MNFELSKEQKLVVQAVREFAETEIKPIAAEADKTGIFPIDQYKKMGRMGLIGLPFSTEYNGAGGDYLSYILAVEEISKVDGSLGISYSVQTSLCMGAINAFASEEQKKKYLPDLCTGKKIGSFGLTEPSAGTDASGAQTVAVKEGDHYILNGQKCFITNSPMADTFVIFAMTDKSKGTKGLSAFIVEKDFPGISIGKIEDKMGIRSSQVGEVIFEDCKVPAENLMGKEGRGFGMAMKTLDGGRIGVAAQALGIAEGALEETVTYMKERKQFGKQLFKFQYLAFKMAEMKARIEQARYLVYKAANDKNSGKSYSVSAALAKMTASDCAMYVTINCVQMLGGYGFIKDYPLERMMRDAKITQIYEGTNEVQKMVISGAMFR
ncbi:acyl-CoA dehydrogenase [Clostridium aestuarii]|uniref:Acyl-CoA dehydrogenase n=1 Tax=Clostridium aestuarii TaxID=338193 RepID=A0ABT4D3Y0_9CLOT|nr:acyl-CoA dehydrogenase [Clostridium aestuarii]MCY6485943.1 acyl-CoA dehydrogenase [Clostridium aestuarii]